MQGWIGKIQESIEYIERNLRQPLDIKAIAGKAALSPFYYQRIFGALCGMTVGEYIRARRMTLAAQDLAGTDIRVIDAALRYGYDSPDSFARAFQRFHGITPSQAREPGAPLRSFAPLHLKIILEGGNMLDYRIMEMPPLTIAGIRKRISSENSYRDIPAFWNEWAEDKRNVTGMLGLCVDLDGTELEYWIADSHVPGEEIPDGCETYEIPGGLWAQFLCRGPLPESLQTVNTQIWTEWLPSLSGYTLAGNYSVEVYMPPAEDPADSVNYIWIPLKKTESP